MHTECLGTTVIAWKKNQLLIQRPIINTYNNINSNAVKHIREEQCALPKVEGSHVCVSRVGN